MCILMYKFPINIYPAKGYITDSVFFIISEGRRPAQSDKQVHRGNRGTAQANSPAERPEAKGRRPP